MKKITFILLALISGTAFAQNATANAAADIVSPLEITSVQDLNFGKVSNNAKGIVVIETDGTTTNSTLSQIGNSNPMAASFNITAAQGYKYSITLPESVTLNSGSNNITVNNFKHDAGENPEGIGSAKAVGVGATLNVAANQPTGNYTGTFEVSVAYE